MGIWIQLLCRFDMDGVVFPIFGVFRISGLVCFFFVKGPCLEDTVTLI